jgi:hypothetical protein
MTTRFPFDRTKSIMNKNELEAKLQQLLTHTQSIVDSGANYNEVWNAVFGVGARYGQLFPTKANRDAIDAMATLKKIRAIIAKVPKPAEPVSEKSGQLILRLPKSLHQALANEADAEGVSLNQLLLSKIAVQLNRAVAG